MTAIQASYPSWAIRSSHAPGSGALPGRVVRRFRICVMFQSRINAIAAVIVLACVARLDAQVPLLPAHEAIAVIEFIGGRVYRNSEGHADIVDLTGSKVSDEHLVLLQSLPTVRVLNLDGSRVTEGGLEQLLKLPDLEEVSLRGTSVSLAAATALKDRHPKVFVVQMDRKGLSLERLAVLVMSLPMGLLGIWLIRLTAKKRSVLSPRLYARGMIWGILLVVASVVVSAVSIVQSLGVDFHLSDLFG